MGRLLTEERELKGFLQDFFATQVKPNQMGYLEFVATTSSQSVDGALQGVIASPVEANDVDAALLEGLCQESGAAVCELDLSEFSEVLLKVGRACRYGQPEAAASSAEQRATFWRGLKLVDLALAHGCAKGSEKAWERFVALYREPLTRAATAITGSESAGRDLADALHAELYGLKTRDGERRSPLESYQGRGSLLSWLRTTLAQRHVDHRRRSFREQPLDESVAEPVAKPQIPEPAQAELAHLSRAVEAALTRREPEDRVLLAAYFLDGRTLKQIGALLRVHEATVSRKLHRLTGDLRRQVLKNLQNQGFSRRAAEEALGADPRDLDLNLRKLLQSSQAPAFLEEVER